MEAFGYGAGVLDACCGDGVEHEGDERRASGFDGDGDEVEPAFVKGASEGGEGGEVFEAIDGFVGKDGLEVPETDACVGCYWGKFEVHADLEEGHGYGLRYPLDNGSAIVKWLYKEQVANLFRLVSSPDVSVRDECQQHVCPPPFSWVFKP